MTSNPIDERKTAALLLSEATAPTKTVEHSNNNHDQTTMALQQALARGPGAAVTEERTHIRHLHLMTSVALLRANGAHTDVGARPPAGAAVVPLLCVRPGARDGERTARDAGLGQATHRHAQTLPAAAAVAIAVARPLHTQTSPRHESANEGEGVTLRPRDVRET